ncbi:hypothetical protein BUALT_Bualt13G0046000 [Buddleja alternifolia]|uniref:C2H2-type domain-containing protein n=1 Tax=Buddleja alternifolia TaxID=168488 RepID=A0AAV6WT86_9LAMI|nr:hypothetical protein BUALT_Bualt13G0046000 [Buddleja alternifolia]
MSARFSVEELFVWSHDMSSKVNEIDANLAREDLSKCLPGWAQTAKRWRHAMSSSSSSDKKAINVFYKILQLLINDKKGEGVDNVNQATKKRKRDSAVRICESEAIIENSNFPFKDIESNSTINKDLLNVEQLEGIKCEAQDELLMNGGKLKGAKCSTEIQENRATGGGDGSRTGTKSEGMENRYMDTQENPCPEGRMDTQENPRSKGRAKCRIEKRRAKCGTCNEKDEELEEGEIEVEKDEEFEEGEIKVQKDKQLDEGEMQQLEREVEVEKDNAQRKLLLLGGIAKCHTGTHKNKCEGRAKCRTRNQNTGKMSHRGSNSSEALEDDLGKYICDICSRSFTTHQALGGHRSSHNKFKINIVNTNEDSRPKSSRRSPSQRAATTGEENSSHLYKTCNKNFPSRRALEGHKRCHSDQGAGSSSSHGKDEKGTKTAQKVLLFDLNKMPDEKDEDGQ